jgi:hypothetical protein
VFCQFKPLRGTILCENIRGGTALYRAFVFQNGTATINVDGR